MTNVDDDENICDEVFSMLPLNDQDTLNSWVTNISTPRKNFEPIRSSAPSSSKSLPTSSLSFFITSTLKNTQKSSNVMTSFVD